MALTIEDMTSKERLHKLVDELSEVQAQNARIVVEDAKAAALTEQADLDAMLDRATARVMHDLDDEERAELGETIAEAWRYESRK